jgi:hypothetical protein
MVIDELCKRFNVTKVFTSSGHKETNGQAERLVRTVSRMMCAALNSDDDWASVLPMLAYAYNSTAHGATQEIPFFLWFGRLPHAVVELEKHLTKHSHWRHMNTRAFAKELWTRQMVYIDKVKEYQDKVKREMKTRHDEKKHMINLAAGDIVWLYDDAFPVLGAKLAARRLWNHWKGPFFVMSVTSENAIISDGKTERTRLVHRNRLRRYVYPLFGLSLEGEKRHAYIEEVTDKRMIRGKEEYEVTWRAVDSIVKEWVPARLVPAWLIDKLENFRAGRRVLPARGPADPWD